MTETTFEFSFVGFDETVDFCRKHFPAATDRAIFAAWTARNDAGATGFSDMERYAERIRGRLSKITDTAILDAYSKDLGSASRVTRRVRRRAK